MKTVLILALNALFLAWPAVARAAENDASPAIATVGETQVTEAEKHDLGTIILSVLLKKYAIDQKITVSEEESAKILALLTAAKEQDQARQLKQKSELTAELKADKLSPEERAKKSQELAEIEDALKNAAATSTDSLSDAEKKEVADFRQAMAQSIIRAWKINKALFAQYGGRVIYQQMGPEPLDAYRKFLEQQMQAGAFKLSNKKYEADLWRTFTNDALHDFVPAAEQSALINTPPWER
jgi:hypothetical protein